MTIEQRYHRQLDDKRAAVEAVCTDMHRPSVNVVGAILTDAEIVFDRFHVLRHARAALDEMTSASAPTAERPAPRPNLYNEGR